MHIRQNALTAVLAMIVMTVLLGIAYPLAITGISQVAFPGNANGQQVKVNGRPIGSKIIGQQFADVVTGKNGKVELDKNGNPVTTPDPRYFQTRPSATTPPDNAAATTFSNLGPNNLTTEQEIAAQMDAAEQEAATLTAAAHSDAEAIEREAAAALAAELATREKRDGDARAELVRKLEDEGAQLVTRYQTLADEEIERLAAFVVADITGLTLEPGR